MDVEQQLRQQQRGHQPWQYGEGRVPLASLPLVPFLTADAYAVVAPAAQLILAATVVVVAALAVSLGGSARARRRWAAALQRSRSGLLASVGPAGAALLLVAWATLIGAHAVFELMKQEALERYAAEAHNMGDAAADAVTSAVAWHGTVSRVLCGLECAGLVAVYVYLQWLSGVLEVGVASPLLAFFPSFYEALTLRGAESDRQAVWVTLGVFLISLFLLVAFITPWIRREIWRTMSALDAHTSQALFRERPEMLELRGRQDALRRKMK